MWQPRHEERLLIFRSGEPSSALPRGQLHCFAGQTKYTCEADDPRLLGRATKETKAAAKTHHVPHTLFTFPTSDIEVCAVRYIKLVSDAARTAP